MNIEKLNQWLTFGANVGVLAGIIFLAYELQQNTQMMKSQTRAQVSEAIIDNVDMGREPDVMRATLKLANNEQLTVEEEFILDNAANATFRMWENNYYQFRSGLFDESEFEAELAVWRDVMSSDAIFQRHWQERKMTYSPNFRIYMDNLIGQVRE